MVGQYKNGEVIRFDGGLSKQEVEILTELEQIKGELAKLTTISEKTYTDTINNLSVTHNVKKVGNIVTISGSHNALGLSANQVYRGATSIPEISKLVSIISSSLRIASGGKPIDFGNTIVPSNTITIGLSTNQKAWASSGSVTWEYSFISSDYEPLQ